MGPENERYLEPLLSGAPDVGGLVGNNVFDESV
jgi:hypothetical protein